MMRLCGFLLVIAFLVWFAESDEEVVTAKVEGKGGGANVG